MITLSIHASNSICNYAIKGGYIAYARMTIDAIDASIGETFIRFLLDADLIHTMQKDEATYDGRNRGGRLHFHAHVNPSEARRRYSKCIAINHWHPTETAVPELTSTSMCARISHEVSHTTSGNRFPRSRKPFTNLDTMAGGKGVYIHRTRHD